MPGVLAPSRCTGSSTLWHVPSMQVRPSQQLSLSGSHSSSRSAQPPPPPPQDVHVTTSHVPGGGLQPEPEQLHVPANWLPSPGAAVNRVVLDRGIRARAIGCPTASGRPGDVVLARAASGVAAALGVSRLLNKRCHSSNDSRAVVRHASRGIPRGGHRPRQVPAWVGGQAGKKARHAATACRENDCFPNVSYFVSPEEFAFASECSDRSNRETQQ